jgi:hypothetical protein
MIPEPEFFNAGSLKKFFALLALLLLPRGTVLKTVKFDRQLCERAINIEEVIRNGALAPELKPSKATGPK